MKERCNALLELAQAYGVHVLVLQEVTAPFVEMLKANQWIKEKCSITYSEEMSGFDYGVAIVSTLPVFQPIFLVPLTTEQGRKAMFMQLFLQASHSEESSTLSSECHHNGGIQVTLVGMHFESIANRSRYRELQMNEIFQFLHEQHLGNDTLILADTNFEGDEEHPSLTENGFSDTWQFSRIHTIPLPHTNSASPSTPATNSSPGISAANSAPQNQQAQIPQTPEVEDAGFTFDTTTNSMAMQDKRQVVRARPDRIWFRCTNLTPSCCAVIGDHPFGPLPHSVHLFPSDHYGLVAHFHL